MNDLVEKSLVTISPSFKDYTTATHDMDSRAIRRAQVANHKALHAPATAKRKEVKSQYQTKLSKIRQERSRLLQTHKAELRVLHQLQGKLFPAKQQQLSEITDDYNAAVIEGDAQIVQEFVAIREGQFADDTLALAIAKFDKGQCDEVVPSPRAPRQISCANPRCAKGENGQPKTFWTTRETACCCCPVCNTQKYRFEHP